MKQILKLVFLLVIGQTAFGQAPSNYTNINGRYRWIAGMFDSTFHIPKGSTPSLRTGGSTNSGGLFYNTSDSSVYTYTGTQWIKLRGSINPSDTTNKYVTQVYKKNASDSVFYVKGGNHLFAFIDSVGSPGGGGGGKVYYFNGGVSMGTIGGFQMYELGDTANTGAAANFTRSTTGNIANFITDPNKPGLLQIPAGVWSVDAWLSETGGGANHAEIWVEVEKWDGSTITTIATSPIEQITEGATPNLYSWSVSIPTTSLSVTDRIIIQFYISNTNGKTVTLYTQNGYVGEVHTTFTTGIGAINGLTAPAQYLVTGTSGTDFNINSSTATHTFNLPTASATNRGALSTTDWSTFNNKIGGSLVSGYLTKATGTNTIDTSQIYQTNGKIGIGKTNPTAKVDVYDSLGTGIKSTLRTQINTDVALDVKAVGNRGFALIVDQADSVASGTQYQTLFRKSMMPGTGNPANGGGVSWYTQIGNDNNVYRALSVYRARVIDSTGFANSNIQQTSTEFWTRKAGVWDTTLVLNGGNVGINTGQNGIDSALTVANGTWLKRGVRMTALPTGVGTKALRIDANGNVSTTDTTATTGFVPYTGATTSLDMGLFNIYGQNIVSNNYATGAAMSSISRSDITASAYGVLQLKRGVWGTLQPNPLTAFDKNWYLPDTSGTLALASQLSGYVPTTRTITINGTSQDLSANRTYNVGTVTSVATNTGTGITGGTITTSGTIAADTLLLSTRAWRQKGVDSVASLINTKISGTTNYIPKFTSSSAIGNSAIYEDGNGNIGLNTLSPISFTNQRSYTVNGTNNGRFDIRVNGTHTASFVGGTSQVELAALTNVPLLFVTNSTERMRLDASGNLGINTSSPAYRLDVVGNFGLNSSGTGLLGIYGANNNTDKYIRLRNSDGNFEMGTSATEHYLLGAGSIPLRFYTNGTLKATLDASGNLGLGVTPSAWTGGTPRIFQFGPGGALGTNSAQDNAFMGANWYYNVSDKYLGNGFATQYRQNAGTHQWYIAPNNTSGAGASISFTQAMTLDASGRLGIGITSPSYKLDVNGTGRFTDDVTINKSSGNALFNITSVSGTYPYITLDQTGVVKWAIQNVATSGLFTITESGVADRFVIAKTSGNVGIGTTSPARKFQVTNAADGFISRFTGGTSSDVNIGIFGSTGAFGSIGTESNHPFNLFTNGIDRISITTAGNVGIGSSNPSQILTVEKNQNATTQLLISNSDVTNSSSRASVAATSGTVTMRMESIGTLGGYIGTTSNHYVDFWTNATERMRLTSSGELLINTTSDAGDYKLQVNGNIYGLGNAYLYQASADADIRLETGGTGTGARLRLKTTAADWFVYTNQSSSDLKMYNGSDLFTLSSAGNLTLSGSIKTAAPSGGTAKPYKWGEAGVAIGGSNGYAVKVEIDGTLYYLMTGYLPEPEPEPSAGPSMGYKTMFEQPTIKIKTESQEIKDLKKEIEELKKLIKNK